jgi:hypothetical protein
LRYQQIKWLRSGTKKALVDDMPNEFKHSLYRLETQRGFRDTVTPVGEPKVRTPNNRRTGGPSRGLVLGREHMDAGEEGEEQGEEDLSAGEDEDQEEEEQEE